MADERIKRLNRRHRYSIIREINGACQARVGRLKRPKRFRLSFSDYDDSCGQVASELRNRRKPVCLETSVSTARRPDISCVA
jgi:hypothetical protein